LADWNVMAPLLAKDHHVVAMDVRGHGRSGDGPWSWNAAVEDVDAVVADFRMKSPAAMGHSLGGMIASLWGWKHPDATGVVNLDGHGNPRADQYVGLDPAWVADKRAELEALQRQQLAALSGPLSDRQVEALMTQQMAIANQVGAPEDQFVEGFQRMLDVRDGGTYLRPAPDGIRRGDLWLARRAVDPPGGSPSAVAWVGDLTAALRKGQTRYLRALSTRQTNVQVETVQGSHGLLFEQSAAIARIAVAFLKTPV
jgi:pimeloyl-ACP methyl ester carboxylesterase